MCDSMCQIYQTKTKNNTSNWSLDVRNRDQQSNYQLFSARHVTPDVFYLSAPKNQSV